MSMSTPSLAAARNSTWGTLTGLGDRFARIYLVAVAAVGVVGLAIAAALSVVGSGGIEALGLGIAISVGGLLASLVMLPALTIRTGLGWGSVGGLFLVLAAELIQSMTTGEVAGALAIAVIGPGVVAVVGGVLHNRPADAADRR